MPSTTTPFSLKISKSNASSCHATMTSQVILGGVSLTLIRERINSLSSAWGMHRWVTPNGRPTYQSAGFHGSNIRVSTIMACRTRAVVPDTIRAPWVIVFASLTRSNHACSCHNTSFLVPPGRWSLYEEPDPDASESMVLHTMSPLDGGHRRHVHW